MDEEQFKTIKGFEDYEISNTGKVRRKLSNTFYNTCINHGYEIVSLYIDGKRYKKQVHRILAETFIPEYKDNMFVYHKDKNRTNNIVSNLIVSDKRTKSLNRDTIEINFTEFEKLEAKRGKGELTYDEQFRLVEMYKQIDKNKAKERTREWGLKKQLLQNVEGIEKDELENK